MTRIHDVPVGRAKRYASAENLAVPEFEAAEGPKLQNDMQKQVGVKDEQSSLGHFDRTI